MFINNITNLLTYYVPSINTYCCFDKLGTCSVDDITSLTFHINDYNYTVKITSDIIEYSVYNINANNKHAYNMRFKIDDPLTHSKLYTLYLECRQKAWENFLKDTKVPIPSSAEDGFAKLMD